jgi:methionyl-tRNA synthetase
MFYITTTIPYINGTPHLGHLLEAVFNDTIFRYQKRLMKQEVKFSMGLDQHGLKIYQKAKQEGLKVQEYVKKQSAVFKDLWTRLEILPTNFIETSSQKHQAMAKLVWQKLLDKNLIYKKKYQGLYCVGDEAFVSPSQLREGGLCPNHDEKPVEMSEENYFFKLSEFTDSILEFLHSSDIRPAKIKSEWINFVKEGLEDISISREKSNLPWGIAVPNDENQVMYVWFEALINYLTALPENELLEDLVKDFSNQNQDKVWHQIEHRMPIDLVYLGKDIAKFHLVVWVGMLFGLGLEPTKTSLIHGFINDKDGRKMSKSLGNGVSPEELIEKFGYDGTRYVILAEMNLVDDTNFDWSRIIDSYNANLADNLGNLLMRVTTLINKHFGGLIDLESIDILNAEKYDLLSKLDLNSVYKYLDNYQPDLAIKDLFKQITKINQYLEEQKPWTLAKEFDKNRAKIESILAQSALSLIQIATALSIFMPETGEKIYQTLKSDRITKADIMFSKIDLNK